MAANAKARTIAVIGNGIIGHGIAEIFAAGGWRVRLIGRKAESLTAARAKIRELKERYDLTVLMAEQNFNQAIKIADRGYLIVHGEIVFEGHTPEALRNNALVKSYYLGQEVQDGSRS